MGAEDAPLSGVRVVDLTHIVAGPACTQLLADAGALVIKVEPPGGEYSRVRGPQRKGKDGKVLTSYNAAVNRGKRNLMLDLKNPAGLVLLDRLIATADVVVDNFAPGALERLGVSYDELRRRHPRLITTSISLWGVDSSDELARRGGVNVVAEAEAGLYDRHRDADGSPMTLSFALADTGGGLAAYAAIVTTLLERDQTGAGRHVNISMVRNVLAMNATNLVRVQRPDESEEERERFSFSRTDDGWVAIETADPRSSHMRVATAGQVLADDDYRDLGYLWDLPDGLGGTITVPANPLGLDYGNRRIPLDLEEGDELLQAMLGVNSADLDALRAAGAFGPTGEGKPL